METIYIIGAGAIGQVLALALVQSGQRVVLLRGHTSQPQPQEQSICVETGTGTLWEATVTLDSLERYPVLEGPVVLTSKSFGNATLAQSLKGKTGTSPLMILQNGLGVEQPFLDAGFPAIHRCVLFVTSQFTQAGAIRFKPVDISPIGTIRGDAARLNDLVAQLSTPLFPFRAEAAIQPIIWKKAIANSVFNSICPLLETDNGIFHRDAGVMALAQRVIDECVSIAQASGVPLSAEEVTQSVLLISRLSDGQLISTLQDIRHKRPTEIDTLNFAIAGIARELQQPAAVPTTALLGVLTKMKSDLNR